MRVIHRALDAGINFIDTADVYSRGESEEIVGKALAGGRRDDVVLATKLHGTWARTPTRRATRGAGSSARLEASLKRLQTDWIDLYQAHRWDPWTDHEETLGALSDLVAQGKVRSVGSSNRDPMVERTSPTPPVRLTARPPRRPGIDSLFGSPS